MKQCTKRMLAWVLAAALLITCSISGLILPATADIGDVLLDEGFEGTEQDAKIKSWWSKGSIVEDPLNAGNKVLKITTALSATYSSKAFGLKPNKAYRFTFKAYGQANVYGKFNQAKGILADSKKKIDTTSGWTEFDYVVRTTDQYGTFNDDAYTIGMYAPVGTYIDDFKLVEIDYDPTNLLFGGDFEQSDAYYADDAWYSINSVGGVVADPDDATNRVMSFNVFGNKYYGGRIGLMPNTTYKLSFRAKGKNLGIYINKTKGFTAGGWYKVLDSAGSDTWVNYERIITTTSAMSASNDSGGSTISFNVANATNISGFGTPDAYIDDVRIERVPATSIAMSQDDLYLAQGMTEPMELTVEPIGGLWDSLEWKSSDETIATVDAEGNVTAATDKTGEVTITATAMVGETPLTASRVITVVGNADTFAFVEDAMHIVPGVKKTAVVLADPKGAKVGNLTFTSSDEAVATVDANGVVTAVAAGTATITVKNADNAIFTEEISDTLTVTVDEAGERVTGGDFETADSAVVTNGVGTVAKDSADRNNQVLQLEKSTDLALKGITLNANKSYKLTFEARGTDVTTTIAGAKAGQKGDVKTTLKETSWTTVTSTFTVGADAAAAAITLKSSAAVEIDNISVVELPEATGIVMVPAGTLSLIPGATAQAYVEAEPKGAFAGDATYASTNPAVATVDASGKITVVGNEGETVIIATSKNEKDEVMTTAFVVKADEYANMLSNGDFEQGDTMWKSNTSGATAAGQIVDGAGRDGGKGVVLTNTVGKKIELFYQGNIPLLPGTTYRVAFDYKTTKSSIVRLWTGSLGFGQVYSTNSGGEWMTVEKVFTTSTTSLKPNPKWDFAIVIEEGGDETMAVDNMRLELYNSGVAAESIEMDRKNIRLVPGRSTGLAVVATPINGDTNMLTWTSSNENVATVEYGVVTGVGKGTATITATTRNGKKATATVVVSGGEALIKNGTFDIANSNAWTIEGSASIADGVGVKETAGGKIEKPAADQTAGKLSQIVKGLKPNTEYTLTLRHAGTGGVDIALINGATELVKKTETAAATYTTVSYKFTTPATLEAETKFELTLASGNGPVYFDYVLLTENATLIDMVVSDIFWTKADGTPLDQDHQIKTGTEVKLYVAVLNQGEDPITAGMTFDVDVHIDGKTAQTITVTAESDVATGEIITAAGNESWKATAGDHTISACANSTLTILELDDSNNDKFQKSVHVADELFEIPEMAEQAGFNELIFNDEFESLHTIDTVGAGEAGYKWYITRPYSNYKQTPDDYEIKDGVLTVKTHNVQYNYELATIDDTTGRGFTFNKGYLEFRFRIPKGYDAGKEGTPAVWSFPAEKILEKAGSYTVQWVEMDWMEYWGVTKDRPNGHYTISMHETIREEKEDGQGNTENVLANHSAEGRHKEGLADNDWHVMSFLWVEDMLLGYFDGVQVHKITYGEGEFPEPLTLNNASEDGTGAFSYMNEQFLALILGGSVDNPLEVDYVRVWGGEGTGYVPPENDGGDQGGVEGGGTVFDIDPETFWLNYCTNDDGDPITAENIDEYSVEYVLMGQGYWELLSDARKAEINALMAENGQPTYDELLEIANAYLNGTLDSGDSPATGERATALPAFAVIVMIVCAVALWATRKRRVNG